MIKADRHKMEIQGDPVMECRTKVEFIESYIKIGNSDYKWNDNHGELIRCKDCKHKEESVSPSWQAWCNRLHCGCDLEWYCADGERK